MTARVNLIRTAIVELTGLHWKRSKEYNRKSDRTVLVDYRNAQVNMSGVQ
jgi:hypothetical protein